MFVKMGLQLISDMSIRICSEASIAENPLLAAVRFQGKSGHLINKANRPSIEKVINKPRNECHNSRRVTLNHSSFLNNIWLPVVSERCSSDVLAFSFLTRFPSL